MLKKYSGNALVRNRDFRIYKPARIKNFTLIPAQI